MLFKRERARAREELEFWSVISVEERDIQVIFAQARRTPTQAVHVAAIVRVKVMVPGSALAKAEESLCPPSSVRKVRRETMQGREAKAKEEQGRANISTARDQECRLWRNGDRHNSSHNGARRIGTHGTSSNGLSHNNNNNNNKGVSSKRQQVRRNLG